MAEKCEVRVYRIIVEREKRWRTKFAFKVRRKRNFLDSVEKKNLL